MNENKEMSNALLEQNGLQPDTVSEKDRKKYQRMFRQQKWITFFFRFFAFIVWISVLIIHVCYVSMANYGLVNESIRSDDKQVIFALSAVEPCLVVLAVWLTMICLQRRRDTMTNELYERISILESRVKQL